MLYKIAVIDDNPTDTEYVSSLVRNWANLRLISVHTQSFPSAEAFLFAHESDRVWDILLLDIEMGALNGIELAKQIRQAKSSAQIIFITGFPDFLAEGYEVSALHYLMKPLSAPKLTEVLDKAASNLAVREKRLCVSYDRQTDFIPLSSILYVEAQKQYVLIHTSAETYRMKSTLTDIASQLNTYFCKCQRSFLVNLQYVQSVKTDSLILTDGTQLPISRGMAETIGKRIIQLF